MKCIELDWTSQKVNRKESDETEGVIFNSKAVFRKADPADIDFPVKPHQNINFSIITQNMQIPKKYYQIEYMISRRSLFLLTYFLTT